MKPARALAFVAFACHATLAAAAAPVTAEHAMVVSAQPLATPLDAALVDDTRVAHGVTPVRPVDASKPAHRDVLVVTLRA